MGVALFALFAVLQGLLSVWGFRLWQSQKQQGQLFAMLIAVALIYDNVIIALGVAIGAGDLLRTLTMGRFIIHALLTPTLLIAGFEIAKRANVQWFAGKNRQRLAGIVVAVLIVIGFITGVVSAHHKLACYAGTLRYTETLAEAQRCPDVQYTEAELTERGLPPIATILTILLVGVESVAIGRKTNWWIFAAGVLVMLITAAIPASRFGPAFANAGEVVLIAAVMFTEQHLQRNASIPKNSPIAQGV